MKALAMALAILMAVSGVVSAAPIGGGWSQHETVGAYSTDSFSVALYGGETTCIRVNGDYDTDLDLYVYDEFGNLVAQDADSTDQCVVYVTPIFDGPFTIQVVNRGSVHNNYRLSGF